MYEQFYKLRERPFALTPDPDYLYPSAIHLQALTRLRHGLAGDGGLVVLTGEIGSGKTTLLHTALRDIEPGTRISWIVNTQLDAGELLEAIVLGFGLDPRHNSREARLIDSLVRLLASEQEAGRRALLVIDEAQNLALAALDRLLAALEDAQAPPLRVVLVGQPSLGDLLRTPELQRLRSRISVRYHLRALEASDTAEYINHRLRHASAGAAVQFPPPVTALIHQQSHGLPRRINVLSDTVLLHAYGEGCRAIDLDIARVALSELERSGVPDVRGVRPPATAPAFAVEPDPVPAEPEIAPMPAAAAVTLIDLEMRPPVVRAREPARRGPALAPPAFVAAGLMMGVVAATLAFVTPGRLAGGRTATDATAATPATALPPAAVPTLGRTEPRETPVTTPGTPLSAPVSRTPTPQPQPMTGPAAATRAALPPAAPPASQAPVADAPAAARPAPDAAATAASSPQPPNLPPVANASTDALPVVPVSRTAPPLPVPPRVASAEILPAVALPPPLARPPAAAPPAAASPAASTPAAAAPSPAVTTIATDERSVRTVVNQYRSAFSALDAGAAKAIWPSVDTRALGRAFSQLASQEFEFDGCQVSVTGNRATAWCAGNARFIPKVGDRTPRLERRRWTFELQKLANDWTIQRVQAQ